MDSQEEVISHAELPRPLAPGRRRALRPAALIAIAVAVAASPALAQVPPPPIPPVSPGFHVAFQEHAPVLPPPPIAVQGHLQGVPAGQWVHTSQYGWVWMPFEQGYTRVTSPAEAWHFVYSRPRGWSWVAAPWVLQLGPVPRFGVHGVTRFAWHRARPLPHEAWSQAWRAPDVRHRGHRGHREHREHREHRGHSPHGW